ncbi:MAG: TonB-dependent receptor, partial [Blastocatellia bacterium]|nr:TonB-dependent receptor [Blastocatellia bacterium]
PSLRSPLQRSFLRAVSVIFPTVIPNFPTGVPLDRLPIPAAYVQGFGDPRLGENIRSNYFSAFVQNDLKAKENLLVKFGVRYDLDRINLTPNNSGNFSPRIAVAYSPKNLQNLRFKAGYGLFFGFLTFGTSAVARQQEVGRLQLLTLPFPFSTLPGLSPGGTLPQSTTLPQGPGLDLVPQFSAVERVDPNLRSSYSQQANLGIDYILNKKTEISLAYNFVRGIKLVSRRNINPIVRPVPNNPLLSMLTGRVDPTQGVINQTESASDSYYNALTATVLYRFSPGFDILGTYTYSKAIDNVLQVFPTEVRLIDVAANSLNIRNERGLSIQDLRHRFILSGNVSLSYSKNPLLRDYQLSFIVSANGSRPYNLITSTDLNMDGSDGDRPNVGRNTGITPGFAAFDVRFQRVVKFSEIYKLNLIFEVFNLFNKTNIDPNAIDRNFLPDMQGNFQLPTQENGRFTLPRERFRGAFLPRQIQLGLRFSF